MRRAFPVTVLLRLPVPCSTVERRFQHCSVAGFPLWCLRSGIPSSKVVHGQERLGLPTCFDVSLPACHGLRTPADLHNLATSVALMLPSGAFKPSASAPRLCEAVPALQGARSPLRPPGYAVDASPLLFAVFPRLRLGRTTRSRGVARPSPTGTCTLPEMPSFAWRDNAVLHLPLETGATQERRLEAVRCKRC